jgi:predicted PurR-regulated permease PerM
MSEQPDRPLPPVAEDLADGLGAQVGTHPGDGGPDPGSGRHERRRLRRDRPQSEAEGLAQRLFAQWSALRDERERQLAPPQVRREELARSSVPPGLDLAAAWSWRFLVIVAAVAVIGWVLDFLIVLVVPVVISLLVAALVVPIVDRLDRWLPRGLAALLTLVAGIASVGALLTFVGREVAGGASDLADSTVQGLEEIRTWLRDGPLDATDSQIDGYIDQVQQAITDRSQDGEMLTRVTELGVTLGHVFAGFFIVLFATYFFMADGARIWSWVVRLSPRTARARVDSSGRVAWISLRQFVRATVVVALVDAIGIAVWAAVLGLPFVAAIGVLVFLGAFVPMVGATVAGSVAVLVALVDQGPWTALLMLIGVIVVQQVEGHVLQPFLMGRWVSVHPLGVIVAIATGVLVAGIVGALVAVPLVAALNAVGQHLAAYTDPGSDPVEELNEDYDVDGGPPERDEDPLRTEEE